MAQPESESAVGLFLLLRVVADTVGGWLAAPGDAAGLGRAIAPVHRRPADGVAAPGGGERADPRHRGTARRGPGHRSGLLPVRGSAEPHLALLSSPTAQALRSQAGSLIAWTGSFAVFAFILGVVSGSVSPAGVPLNIERQLAKLGSSSITGPGGHQPRAGHAVLPAARAAARFAGGLDRQNARREGRRRPRHRWVQGVLAFIVVGRVGWW